MAKVDPRDFLLNTDYEMDKIIYFQNGSLDAGQYDIDIPHKLGFTPLIFGVCAFNEDFSDSRSVPFDYTTQSDTIQFTAAANSTNVRLSYINYNGTPNKIFYRIYGFEPDGTHNKVSPTSKYAQNFIINTDYNYCKLFEKGATEPTSTITHGLGYIPQTLAWIDTGTWIRPAEESSTTSKIIVTDQNISFQYPALGISKIHYRIYFDEA